MDELSIKRFGDPNASILCKALDDAFFSSLALDHKLSDFVLSIEGMSGVKYRRLINNLIGNLPGARYLEIGSWGGSTACSALYENSVTVKCIDNWSEFGGPKDRFFDNIEKCSGPKVKFSFIESDFRDVDYSNVGKYNVYLFDGPHAENDQADGVTMVLPALDREFVLIVDDYNNSDVERGTWRGIAEGGLTPLYVIEIRSTQDGSHPETAFQNSDWHNGYILGVFRQ